MAVHSSIPWPTRDTEISFRGQTIVLSPETPDTSPGIEIEYEAPMTSDQAYELLRRFMSALAWLEGGGISELFCVGSTRRIGLGRGPRMMTTTHFSAYDLPEPSDEKALLALALYNEALRVNSKAYQFLGFYKIINVLYESGAKQKAWIRAALPSLASDENQKRIQEITALGLDVADYLYESGRCAVAHAYSNPVVDPDEPKDIRRLSADLPLMKALAEYLIEHDMGVKSQATIWHEHLYELKGFRSLVGLGNVEALKREEQIDPEAIPSFPPVSIRLREKRPYEVLEVMKTRIVECGKGTLRLQCHSRTAPLVLSLLLDFAQERLRFDFSRDIQLIDDQSPHSTAAALELNRFLTELILNGELEVRESETDLLLGRLLPYIPFNMDPRRTMDALQADLERLQVEHARRLGGS